MTPPKIVPCALVSLGISTTRMAGSCPCEPYLNPVSESLISQKPNGLEGKRQRQKWGTITNALSLAFALCVLFPSFFYRLEDTVIYCSSTLVQNYALSAQD